MLCIYICIFFVKDKNLDKVNIALFEFITYNTNKYTNAVTYFKSNTYSFPFWQTNRFDISSELYFISFWGKKAQLGRNTGRRCVQWQDLLLSLTKEGVVINQLTTGTGNGVPVAPRGLSPTTLECGVDSLESLVWS